MVERSTINSKSKGSKLFSYTVVCIALALLAIPLPVVAGYSLAVAAPKATQSAIPVGSAPWAVAFDSANNELYVTNNGGNNVSVINATSGSVIKTIAVGKAPEEIAYDSANKELYVANNQSNSVSVIS